MGIRQSASDNQAKQAEIMRTRSKKYMPPCEVGNHVALSVPDCDRGPSDGQNIICEILNHNDENELYRLGCAAGILETQYARSAFTLLAGEFEFDIPVNLMGLRAAVTALSLAGGQGFTKCDCPTGTCTNKRCGCFKKG